MPKNYYLGSSIELPIGTILKPQPNYEERWSSLPSYYILESYRPKECLAHKDAVFLCDNPDDIDCAGGCTDYLFTVQPIGKLTKHDMNWQSEICCILSEEDENLDKIIQASKNYWSGIPHYNESVWEYLCAGAVIIAVEPY